MHLLSTPIKVRCEPAKLVRNQRERERERRERKRERDREGERERTPVE